MKIKLLGLLLSIILPLQICGQEYSSSFNVVRLPSSSHAAALGGQALTVMDDYAAAGWNNPALYANVSDLSLGLNFMTYAAGSTLTGAHFVKGLGERHTLAAGAQYMNYGKMDETDETGNVLGEFSAKDIVIGGGYSYLLSDRWTGGANLKFIFSNLADYSSIAMSVDVGLNYYDEEQDISVSAVLQNIGTQVKSYDDGLRTHLPFSIGVGLSKGMAHLPVRFHITMTDINRWKSSYYVVPDNEDQSMGNVAKEVSFGKKLLNHFIVGIDVLPTDYMYLSLGYNFRRAYELKASGSSHLAGFTAGGGLNVKRIKFGVSYAKYHRAGNSLMFNAGYTL